MVVVQEAQSSCALATEAERTRQGFAALGKRSRGSGGSRKPPLKRDTSQAADASSGGFSGNDEGD